MKAAVIAIDTVNDFVSEDYMTSPDKKVHKYAPDYVRMVYGAKITNSADIIGGWGK